MALAADDFSSFLAWRKFKTILADPPLSQTDQGTLGGCSSWF